MIGTAEFSASGRYRFSLTRTWGNGLWEGPGPTVYVLFVMLNPSKAGAEVDDPTIRKCIGFAKQWGFGGLMVVNLFPLVATDPVELRRAGRIPYEWVARNGDAIKAAMDECGTRVAAWGTHAAEVDPTWAAIVRANLAEPSERWKEPQAMCLGKTKDGHPKHPLYVPYAKALEPLEAV